jgi:hypothetical protein
MEEMLPFREDYTMATMEDTLREGRGPIEDRTRED